MNAISYAINNPRTVDLGNSWEFNVSPIVESLSASAVEEMIAAVGVWQQHAPKGDTWVQRTHGAPSLFVRLDCVWTHEGGLQLYEVEDKPCGMHAVTLVSEAFKHRRDQLMHEWPRFRWVTGENRESDDAGWLGQGLSLQEALHDDCLVLVRCMPEKAEYCALNDRSVSTIEYEGDKRYGVPMGLWNIVTPEDDGRFSPALPSLGEAFVAKPIQGTRCRNVLVCKNGATHSRYVAGRGEVAFLGDQEFIAASDVTSLARVEKYIREWGGAVCQPYIAPLQRADRPGLNIIYRVYLGYSPRLSKWVALGGVWIGAPSQHVHGTQKTITGPLVLEGI